MPLKRQFSSQGRPPLANELFSLAFSLRTDPSPLSEASEKEGQFPGLHLQRIGYNNYKKERLTI
jgi:hypothetical protein